MSEYIFDVPDENEPIGDVYYPDERDAPMPVTPLVRCRDCKHAEPDNSGRSYYEGMLWCSELGGDDSMPVEYDDFCAWGERK